MDFEELFSTEGRMRRLHYVGYLFALSIASYVIQIVAGAIMAPIPASIAALVVSLPLYWISYCIAVRRAHDMGQGSSFVIAMCACLGGAILLMAAGGAMAVLGMQAGLSLIGLASILGIGYCGMNLILIFAGPDKTDSWGRDPRFEHSRHHGR